jgi:hypothetical protein
MRTGVMGVLFVVIYGLANTIRPGNLSPGRNVKQISIVGHGS